MQNIATPEKIVLHNSYNDIDILIELEPHSTYKN